MSSERVVVQTRLAADDSMGRLSLTRSGEKGEGRRSLFKKKKGGKDGFWDIKRRLPVLPRKQEETFLLKGHSACKSGKTSSIPKKREFSSNCMGGRTNKTESRGKGGLFLGGKGG